MIELKKKNKSQKERIKFHSTFEEKYYVNLKISIRNVCILERNGLW